MKKKRIVFLSIFIMVISIALTTTKNVSASEIIPTNYCPTEVIIEQAGKLEYIPGIKLPKYIVKSLDGTLLNYGVITIIRNNETPSGYFYKGYEGMFMSGLIEFSHFSNNTDENSYYLSILYLLITNQLNVNERLILENSKEGKKITEKFEEIKNFFSWSYTHKTEDVVLNTINTDSITYTVTDDYIETNLIIPDCPKEYSYVFTDYQVNVPSPITVVDKEGNTTTEFQRGEGFKLRIPISDINNNSISVTANIIGKGKYDTFGSYGFAENASTKGVSKIDAVINCKRKGNEYVQFNPININYTLQTGNLNINVIDTETKEKLSNATISIFDRLGNLVYQTTTTNNEINVTLPVGEYTVKQTTTPENYQPVTIEKKVTVIENQESEAILENIKLVEVPDLGQRVKGIVTMIGGITVIIGGSIIGINLIKKKNN